METIPCRPIEVFLRPSYLAQGLSADERLSCHIHHYRSLTAFLSPLSLAKLFDAGLIAFERIIDGTRYEVLLFQPKMNRNQGELSLSLLRDGTEIYAIGLTFTPAAIFEAHWETSILISRMQGVRGFEEIRSATKAFHDVTPQALLFASLRGIGCALGISNIVGPSARLQVSFTLHRAAEFAQAYDEFFATLSAVRSARGFYVINCEYLTDVLSNLPAKHRARTKSKRIFKAAVANEAFVAFTPHRPEPDAANNIHLSATHLATRVGKRLGATIATTGVSGVLVCGPYPPVLFEPGGYDAFFLTQIQGRSGHFRIEVAADFGATPIAQVESVDLVDSALLRLPFEVAQGQGDIEFRVIVHDDTSLILRGIRVAKQLCKGAAAQGES